MKFIYNNETINNYRKIFPFIKPYWKRAVIALGLSQEKIPVLFVSYDLSGITVSERLLSSVGEIDLQRFKSGNMGRADWENMANAMNVLGDLEENKYLNIYAGAHLYYKDLFNFIRKFKKKHNKGVL